MKKFQSIMQEKGLISKSKQDDLLSMDTPAGKNPVVKGSSFKAGLLLGTLETVQKM